MEAVLVKHSLTLTFGLNATIRRAVNDIEDIVKTFSEHGYAQPQIVPIPDDIEPEIPRVIFSSRAGHSQILVTQISVSFNVDYSEDWSHEPEKCHDYLLKKVDMLFAIGRAGWKTFDAPLFSGVTTTFAIKASSSKDAAHLISSSFSDSVDLEDANEASYRVSQNVDSRYYQNIAVTTYVKLKNVVTDPGSIPRVNEKTIEEYGVLLVSDHNDRLAYNINSTFVSNAENLKNMIRQGYKDALEVSGSLLSGCEQ